jgi:hypothetical protein
MAQTYNFAEAGVELVIPSSYVNTTVVNGNTATATTGIVALVGEADSGPSYDNLEKVNVGGAFILRDKTTKERVAFTPDELTVVKGLFKGGRLVDAFKGAAAPFAANVLNGAPTLIYCIRTNKTDGEAAKADLVDGGSPKQSLATFVSKATGLIGNSITVKASNKTALSNGLTPIQIDLMLGATPETHVVNTGLPLKVKATTGSPTISVTQSAVVLGGATTIKLAGLTVTDLIQAINKGKGAHHVEASLGETAYQFAQCTNLFDTTTYTLSGADVSITMCGKQLKDIAANSSLVDVTPTYVVPELAAAPTICQTGSLTITTPSLSGGVMGATTNEDVEAALKKLEIVNVNFVVPLFSQDAIDDATDGLTSEDSDYEINNVTQYAVDHVKRMSAIKVKKNRQAFLSRVGYQDAISLIQSGSYMLDTPRQYRASVAFEGVLDNNAFGVETSFQPWMASVKAAGAQAVAGYRPIFNKAISISGIIDPSDFGATIPEYEEALKSGLLVLSPSSDGFNSVFLSDQTAYYYPDNNFVYNSIQAVYGADVIAQTLQQQMQVYVGQSNGDVNATVALVYLQSVMSGLLLNKWIAASSDAPAGYRNATVAINGPVMKVSIEAKEATGIYFVPINLSISAVQSAA